MVQLSKKKQLLSIPLIIIGLLSAVLLVASSLFLLFYPSPSETLVPYSSGNEAVVLDGKLEEEEVVIRKNNVSYFSVEYIKQMIDDSVLYDEASKSVILTTKDRVLQIPTDSLNYFINEVPTELKFPVMIAQSGVSYVALDPLLTLFELQMDYDESTGIHVLRRNGETIINASVRSDKNIDHLRLRTSSSLTAPYVYEVQNGEEVSIEKEEEGFYYVRKQNGIAGYIEKSEVEINQSVKIAVDADQVTYELPKLNWPIHLVWEAVYSKNPDTKKIPSIPGVNVVSPTWFSLENNQGGITNLGSMEYVEWAKSKNFHIWGLFSNDFDPDKTHGAFKHFETRQHMIRQLLHYAKTYKLDGINIDIENVYEEDGPLITQFVREATPYFHQAGLLISMDVTFISDSGMWSAFYEREKLAEIVDYMVVMAYDEHWATSPIAGSVASLPWVEGNLNRILEVIPNERLILGVPLYSRIWKEQETEGGNIEVSSKAHSMESIQAWIKEHHLQVTYDEKTGQNYAEFYNQEEKSLYKVWIEDEMSLNKRAQLVHKYQLAGVASWQRTFASDVAWQELEDSLNRKNAVKQPK
ncbi:glycosyl hydrolase family 18 protein [Litchfieldia salsa]|uniref:Spore germination protein YaaH n=1 Tax=Litchfieldia salsa TaxID=930152 RepID=A0A1H0SSJ9_9BACI|nr:glycosyl hydrolase family 18 protein [Litchfieldia salsa]SDP44683.1 Spore germination protein YaaH [Litchfieldia salsa]